VGHRETCPWINSLQEELTHFPARSGAASQPRASRSFNGVDIDRKGPAILGRCVLNHVYWT